MTATMTPRVNRLQDELERTFGRFFPQRAFGEPLVGVAPAEPVEFALTPIDQTTVADYDLVFGVNVRGLFAATSCNAATASRPMAGPTTITEVALRRPPSISWRIARLTPSLRP